MDPSAQSTLKDELDIRLPREIMLGKELVFTNLGSDDFGNLVGLNQHAQSPAIRTRVVRNHRQPVTTESRTASIKSSGDTTEVLTTYRQRHTVVHQLCPRLSGTAVNFGLLYSLFAVAVVFCTGCKGASTKDHSNSFVSGALRSVGPSG